MLLPHPQEMQVGLSRECSVGQGDVNCLKEDPCCGKKEHMASSYSTERRPGYHLKYRTNPPSANGFSSWARGWGMAELFPESKTLVSLGFPQSILRRACGHIEPGEEKTEVSDSCDIHLYLEEMVGTP